MLDLPYVAPHLAPNAVVLGGQTLRHTLAPLDLPLEFVDMNDHLATPERMGTWHSIAGGRVRVMAIASGHPNNYAFVHLWTGVLSADRAAAPERAADYLEGITLAYLVDFLSESGEIAHRIYVQTSSRGWPDGFFPPALLEERPVDVALLAMDCANISAQERPRPILDFLQPKSVIFCHWENFFRTKQQSPRDIVKVNLPRLKRWFDQHATQPVYFPGWDTRYQFSDPP
jgi:hypothetical protein